MNKQGFIKMNIILVLLLVVSVFSVNAELSDSKAITISLVNQDPDPSIAGNIVEIRLGVENIGGKAAENLILEIIPEYPFTMVPGEEATTKIGTMKAYQTGSNMKIVKFKLRVDRDATAGGYELKIKEYEEGKESVSGQKSINIDVENRESAEVIHIDKTTLIPGKQSSLTFTVNNVGSAPLRDLTFNWVNDESIILPVGSDNTKYIKYVDIGESAELEYQVIADPNAEPGLYKLNLYLTYDDPITGEDKEITTIAGINVGGGTDFDVAFSESSMGETSFSVANIGSNPAYSVLVIIPQQQGWRVSGSNSMIIGNLNKGDYTVASFSLQSGTSRTEHNTEINREELMAQRGTSSKVEIQIAYTDTMGERKTVEKEVSLNPQSLMTSMPEGMTGRGFQRQSGFSKYKAWLVTIAIVVIGLVFYKVYKKRKLKNSRFKFRDFFRKK